MKKNIILFTAIIIAVILFSVTNITGLAVEKSVSKNMKVNANILNVRLGPGLDFPIVTKLYQNEIVKTFEYGDGWYLIKTQGKEVGMVKGEFLKDISNSEKEAMASKLVEDEKYLLKVVNELRSSKGLKKLKIDEKLNQIAYLKAEDIEKNNYFSNKSPKYGSPFDMMNSKAVKFKSAGENLAGSETVKDGYNEWLKIESHKKNILNKNYNYTGIAVIKSKKYGKIIVQEFVGR